MKRTEEIEIKITVECEGDYSRGANDSYENGQWYPGDPSDVDDFKVFMYHGTKRIEITEYLAKILLEDLSNEFLQICDVEKL